MFTARCIPLATRIGGRLQLTETKTPKSGRTVPLPQYAVRALRAGRLWLAGLPMLSRAGPIGPVVVEQIVSLNGQRAVPEVP